MLKVLKNLFHNPEKETVRIFEEKTRINYDTTLFSSLEVLSLNNSQLNYLNPLSVFHNLKILNLSNNNIQDISCLNTLRKLKIIDLRFNKITKIPLWVFKLNITIYWERENEEQEGIYFEGNPLDEKLISKIKNYPRKENLLPLIVPKKEKKTLTPIEAEQLIPLQRQLITIFTPQFFSSNFIKIFSTPQSTITQQNSLKVNISIIEYSNNLEIIQNAKQIHYIILILKETECCINPPILEHLSKLYIHSKIFLIIENSSNKNIQEKITFFKTYNKSINIIEIYHSFEQENNKIIKEKIYNYLKQTQEATTLWRKNWIALRDEIEIDKASNISSKEFQYLADKHHISSNIRDDIFIYLKKVGSIKKRH